MYIITYRGKFAFIKPWTAVRDGETFSQQFLTPSIIEGIEKKLFPELLSTKGIKKIIRHKLRYDSMSSQQEVTQSRGWKSANKKVGKISGHEFTRDRSIINRAVLINPILYLGFELHEDAVRATKQHICLCRNEDVLLPDADVCELSESEFNDLQGFEMRFGVSEQSFLVGYNRFQDNEPMYGWLEYNGSVLL